MPYRHSIVVEFLSTVGTDTTPTPVCEMRTTLYTRGMVDPDKIRKILIDEVARLAFRFYSIRVAIVQGRLGWSVSLGGRYSLRLEYSKRIIILSGLEYNVPVTVDEMAEHVAQNVNPYFAFVASPLTYINRVKMRIRDYYRYPIYNAIFYERDGTVKREFNHWEIVNYVARDSATFTRAAMQRGELILADFSRWKEIFIRMGGFE